jgi:tetratricopeptide (TPR) repeat protein
VALRPDAAAAHNNLGIALRDKKDLEGAIAAYKKAIELDPKLALAHNNLGAALRDKKDLEGAVAEYKKAIEINPTYTDAHFNLGNALMRQGRFPEAEMALRRSLEFYPEQSPWRQPAMQQLQQCERLAALDAKLPAIFNGEAGPAPAAEQVEIADLCRQYKRLHAAAARFYTDAFAADPRLAADLRKSHRYNAACSAALASAGQGDDAKNLPDKVQLMLRRQALTWLRADLVAWSKFLDSGQPQARATVERTLQHWQSNPDLVGVRDKAGLARLPDAERQAWEKLWADVEALRKQAREGK